MLHVRTVLTHTGYMSEVMAKVAAYNLVSSTRGNVESDLKDIHFGG